MRNRTIPPKLKVLFEHVVNSPELPRQLNTLHDLALYESGDALLGSEEKQALLNVNDLSLRLRKLGKRETKYLKSLL